MVNSEEMKRREKRFAELFVFETHGNLKAAYKKLLEETNRVINEDNIRKCASRFFRREGVQEELKKCRKEAEKLFVINKEQIIENLTDIATDEDTRKTDRIAALKELNTMAGFNKMNVDLNASAEIDVIIE